MCCLIVRLTLINKSSDIIFTGMIYQTSMVYLERVDRQTGYISILLYLSKGEKANVKKLSANLDMANETIYRAISLLEKDDLIEEKEEWGKSGRGWKRKNYYLTAKGKKVAKKLKEIEGIVEA